MIDNLTINVSAFDTEMWVLMILGLSCCMLMIFAPQLMRELQDTIEG